MNQFEYDAPQFRDFKEDFDDSDGADTFFDVESDDPTDMAVVDENKENSQPKKEDAPMITIEEDTSSKQYQTSKLSLELSVMKPENQEKLNSNKKKRDMLKAVRRLSAVGPVDQEKLSIDLNKLSVKNKRRTCFEGISLCPKEEKCHAMTTRSDQASKTPTIELRTRAVIKEPTEANRKRKSVFGDPRSSAKYMAMAEKILHFQKDTPPRFHTNRRLSSGIHKNLLKARKSYNPRRTIALTPKLMTSMRSRPLDVLTAKQKEEMELEEMKKHQVKPVPLNEKIFQPPQPPRKSIRPPLVPKPFKLTEVFKKPAVPSEGPYKFTANPVPKTILEKPVGVGKRVEIPVTIPQSPAITKPTRQVAKPVRLLAYTNDNKASTEYLHSFGVNYKKFCRKTEVKPFSFETRDKKIIEKKEKKIQEILEAEKKAREFKANPVPASVLPKEINRSSKHSHLDCSKSSIISLVDEGHQPFKARSPRVLRKAPFEPKLVHSHSQPLDVQLWTERRAQDREEYEIRQLEKQERLACLKDQVEMEKKRKEEEEILRMRKETVHKAQPMPKYKERALPKLHESNLPLTSPMSPRFSKRIRSSVLPCAKSLPQ